MTNICKKAARQLNVLKRIGKHYLKEFLPYFVVLGLGISAVFIYLKLYILFLMVTRSCKNKWKFLCIMLKASKAIVLILQILSVANICKKAERQLNVLKRIGKHLDRFGKLNIYHSFIMSNFSYCPLTWHFCNDPPPPKKKYKNVISGFSTMIN
jgi:hypothetical protein